MNTYTPLGRFRLVAISEGISYVLLLFIAMPLKYMMDMPLAVKYTGWAHGLLFILYILTLLHAAIDKKWGIIKMVLYFVASLIPFAAFYVDAKYLKHEK